MNSKQLLLLAIYHCNGEIRGKTLLQKRLYFLDVLLKEQGELNEKLPDLEFIPYYFGPYSPIVNDDLIYMKIGGMLSEGSVQYDFINQAGYPARRIDYKATDKGRMKAEELVEKYPDLSEKIKNICNIIISLDENNQDQIAIDAKTHFILKTENSPLTKDNIKEIAKKRCKWIIDKDEQIEKAFEHLNNLDLAEETD